MSKTNNSTTTKHKHETPGTTLRKTKTETTNKINNIQQRNNSNCRTTNIFQKMKINEACNQLKHYNNIKTIKRLKHTTHK